MKSFFELCENTESLEWEINNARLMIVSHIGSAANYIKAGRDVDAVLNRLKESVKTELDNVIFMLTKGLKP